MELRKPFAKLLASLSSFLLGISKPPRIPNTMTTILAGVSGNIATTSVWNGTLTVGVYDIVVDVDGNGRYNVGVDALCHNRIANSAGFIVIPEYGAETILAIVALSTALLASVRARAQN